MPTVWRSVVLSFVLVMVGAYVVADQTPTDWRISPTKINIQLGQDRPLQLLDTNARELFGADWSVDNPDLADLESTDDGRVVIHPKAVGSIRVSATINGEMRSQEINIWSAVGSLPPGTTRWSAEDIGREIRDLPAVPTAAGPNLYSLEQNPAGDTYLRAFSENGIQVWAWHLPEHSQNVELVCGDWTGGALISANHPKSFTLYTVGGEGKLQWQQNVPGLRKGHAYNLQHLVHVLSQSADGTGTLITAFDEITGAKKFELPVPASHETMVNLRRTGSKYFCVSNTSSVPIRTIATQLMVNMDGLAYAAFTENQWTLSAPKCTPGVELRSEDISFNRDERLILWQIHPDGTVRSTVVDGSKTKQAISVPVSVASPTGAIITDNSNGVLLSVRWSHNVISENIIDSPDEFVYRINPSGEVLFKVPLPKYSGPLHDDMVIGEHDTAFATRGGTLVAFNLRNGRESWHWDSNTPEISVFAALANGACVVKTPTGLAEVDNGVQSHEMPMDGAAMLDWQGNFYRSYH